MTSDEWLNFFEHPDVFAFCAKIAENPDDLAPKLVFADWLEENCPDERFVQTYRDVVTGKEHSSRDMILPDDAEDRKKPNAENAWYYSIRIDSKGQFGIVNWADATRLRRLVSSGLIYYVSIPSDYIEELPLPETLHELHYWVWEREVPLGTIDFSHIRKLMYSGPTLEARSGYELLESTSFTNLESLNIHGDRINDDFLFRLAFNPILSKVKELELPHIRSQGIGLEAIAGSPYVQEIRILSLFDASQSQDVLRAVLDSTHLSKLQNLCLVAYSLPADVENFWTELATNTGSNRLIELSLSMDAILPDHYSQFFRSPNFQSLERLNIEVARITNEPLRVFLESPSFPNLKRVSFYNSKIDDEGAIAIANAPRMRKLDDICLRLNFDITEVGWRALLESPYLTPSAKVSIQEAKVELEEWGKEVESPEEPAPPEE